MRVGVMVPKPGPSASAWIELAQRFERATFDFLAFPDHYGQGPAPIPALAAIGGATSSIGLVPLTLNCGKRTVGGVVDDVATLSAAFGQRVRIGLGVGWHDKDWSAHGDAMAPFGERLAKLARVAKELRTGLLPAASYVEGRSSLKPQIIIGGAGKRLLTAAVEYADVVGLGPDLARGSFDSLSVEQSAREATIERCNLVGRLSCEGDSRRPIQVLVLQLVLTDDARAGYQEIAHTYSTSVRLVSESPHFLAGTPQDIRAKLAYWVARHHVREIVVNQVDLGHSVERLAEFVGIVRSES